MQVRANLPRLVKAVRDSGQVVTWVCDPMHGNTECVAGFKTRRFERIRAEVRPLPVHQLSALNLPFPIALHQLSAPSLPFPIALHWLSAPNLRFPTLCMT